MFKSFAISSVIFTTAVVATAQDLNTISMPMVGWCAPIAETARQLTEKYGERPIISGNGFISIPNGNDTEIAEGTMVITANLDSGSFTVNISFTDGMNCIVLSGFGFSPWPNIGESL